MRFPIEMTPPTTIIQISASGMVNNTVFVAALANNGTSNFIRVFKITRNPDQTTVTQQDFPAAVNSVIMGVHTIDGETASIAYEVVNSNRISVLRYPSGLLIEHSLSGHNFFSSEIKPNGTIFVFSRAGSDRSISISELSPSGFWRTFLTGITFTALTPYNFHGELDEQNRYYLLYSEFGTGNHRFALIEEGKSPLIITTIDHQVVTRTRVSISPDNLLHFLIKPDSISELRRLLPNQSSTYLISTSILNFEILPAKDDTRLIVHQDSSYGS